MTELWPLPPAPLVREVGRCSERLRLGERYRELDRSPEFPSQEFRALGRARLLGLTLSPSWGGRGLPAARAAAVLFHLAYRGGTTFAKLAMQPEFCSVLSERGSPALRAKWFRPLMQGRALVGNHITEPSGGSDAHSLATVAERRGARYRITGTKSEIAFAVDAGAALVYARAPGTRGADGISAFVVPQDLPGVTRRVGSGDLGERWQRRGTVVYDGVEVPLGARVGAEGEGFRYLRRELVRDRGLLAAIYLGVARAAWDETTRSVGQRVTFGERLAERQAVAFPLLEDIVALESTWLFVEQALARFDRGEDATAATALAKVRATDVALEALDHAIQFHGGAGYSSALPHEQRWRDVRSGPIAHGPSEVLRTIAARRLWATSPGPVSATPSGSASRAGRGPATRRR